MLYYILSTRTTNANGDAQSCIWIKKSVLVTLSLIKLVSPQNIVTIFSYGIQSSFMLYTYMCLHNVHYGYKHVSYIVFIELNDMISSIWIV